MAIDTSEEFFAVLEKSKLLDPTKLAEARAAGGEHAAATTVARALAKAKLLTRWQAGQLLAGRSTFFLGKYKLIDLLGRGAMGGVFLAEHVTMNRLVALKTISRKIARTPPRWNASSPRPGPSPRSTIRTSSRPIVSTLRVIATTW